MTIKTSQIEMRKAFLKFMGYDSAVPAFEIDTDEGWEEVLDWVAHCSQERELGAFEDAWKDARNEEVVDWVHHCSHRRELAAIEAARLAARNEDK